MQLSLNYLKLSSVAVSFECAQKALCGHLRLLNSLQNSKLNKLVYKLAYCQPLVYLVKGPNIP